eukprot:5813996-Amphidinium_carterae.1
MALKERGKDSVEHPAPAARLMSLSSSSSSSSSSYYAVSEHGFLAGAVLICGSAWCLPIHRKAMNSLLHAEPSLAKSTASKATTCHNMNL